MNMLVSTITVIASFAMHLSSWLAIIGGIWLAVLGEIEIVVIGVICMLVGQWVIGICLWPSIGIGALAMKAYDYSKILCAILTFFGMLASFAVFYIWGCLTAQAGMNVFLHCGALIPCALFGFGVAESSPAYQVDTPINVIHSASITIGYLALFIIATFGNFSVMSINHGMLAMIILFVVAAVGETIISMKEAGREQE